MQEEKRTEETIQEETIQEITGKTIEDTQEEKALPGKKRWFGRGIYGSKDVPIRLLDGLIAAFIVAIIIMTVVFAVNGGFMVSFSTDGGSSVESQKLRYGEKVAQPETPVKPGYVFDGWYQENEPEKLWNFETDKVGGELVLAAKWIPAEITVKFDLDGGSFNGKETIDPITVTYQKTYGKLPVPEKEGAEFKGWTYSGQMIEEDTAVTMTGEHVLTAVWEE